MGLSPQAKAYCRTVVGKPLDLVEDIAFFRSLLSEVRPDMVVLDSFTSLFSGSPNSPTKARPFLRTLRSLAEDLDFGVLLLHHTDRAGHKYIGSFAVGQSVDAVFVLNQTDADLRVVTCDKMRAVAMPGPRTFRVTAQGLALPASPEASKGDEFFWSPEIAENELAQWADELDQWSDDDNDTRTPQ
jgi:predicted ATP-dependent serine protease